MIEHNFWFWLLDGIARQVNITIVRIPEHQYWGLATSITSYSVELLTIMLRYLGTFIGLRQLGIMVSLIIMFEIVLWLRKLGLGLFTIIKFFL